MVAGCAAVIQSAAKKRLGRVLTPAEMRNLLIQTGKPQSSGTSMSIGPLPDLQQALPEMMVRFKPGLDTYDSWGRYYFADPNPPADADPDGDGIENQLEYFLGTDPLVQTSTERLPVLSGGSDIGNPVYEFSFYKEPNRQSGTWQAEKSETLQPAQWVPLIPGTDGVEQIESGNKITLRFPSNAPKCFVRLKVTR
jgi:hypothetical protein